MYQLVYVPCINRIGDDLYSVATSIPVLFILTLSPSLPSCCRVTTLGLHPCTCLLYMYIAQIPEMAGICIPLAFPQHCMSASRPTFLSLVHILSFPSARLVLRCNILLHGDLMESL